MPSASRLITRGFGPKTTPTEEAGPITMGLGAGHFGPLPPRILIHNRIVTRGFSDDSFPVSPGAAGPIVQGYGALTLAPIEETAQLRIRQKGQSGTKRSLERLHEVIVAAKLIEVNGDEPDHRVQGWIRVRVNPETNFAAVQAEHVSQRARSPLEDITVEVKRVKRE